VCHHLSLSSLSHGLSKGRVGVEIKALLHVVTLQSFWTRFEAIYFCNLG
jgi:hypothetical protein